MHMRPSAPPPSVLLVHPRPLVVARVALPMRLATLCNDVGFQRFYPTQMSPWNLVFVKHMTLAT